MASEETSLLLYSYIVGTDHLMPQGWAITAGRGSTSERKTPSEKFIRATAISTSSSRIRPKALAILHPSWSTRGLQGRGDI